MSSNSVVFLNPRRCRRRSGSPVIVVVVIAHSSLTRRSEKFVDLRLAEFGVCQVLLWDWKGAEHVAT